MTWTPTDGKAPFVLDSSTKLEFKVGRADPKATAPDVDLGKDSGASRETCTVQYKMGSFIAKHAGSCVMGFVVLDYPMQLLENFVIDIGGKMKYMFYGTKVNPAAQIKEKDDKVHSPLYILEARTEGIQKGNQTFAELQLVRIVKKDEVPIPIGDKPSLSTEFEKPNSWKFGKGGLALPDLPDYAGTLEIGYQQLDGTKGFWYIRELVADAKNPTIVHFRNKIQLPKNQESDDFRFINGGRVMIGSSILDIKVE